MESRRAFLKKAALLSGSTAMANMLPAAIQKALAINPLPGSTYLDAEHIVILMQENRSFDHCFGTLAGVRGFNDPRAILLPNQRPVWLQTDAAANTYAPFRVNIKNTKITWMGELPHSRSSQVDANNSGKYDKWLIAKKPDNKAYADMPLAMGYYSREDLPFHYAMADAFTVCDQNFSSAMTSTTPNRSFFWTGKITHEEEGKARVNIRNNNFLFGKVPWGTFPELLEENGIPWKFYQNDVDCGGGFSGEERAWLSNFGCNNLEFFKAYNVKFNDRNVASLQKLVETLPAQISKLQEEVPSGEKARAKLTESIRIKQEVLANAKSELIKWSNENFEKLSEREKNLYRRAFVTNSGDPDFRSLMDLDYKENGKQRRVSIPKGDLFYQFRKDVNQNKLPAVSWLAAPHNFSDHPSSPWYGAWYMSEVLEILTKNPEVWKKTIFITTYDENDGYFDHIPPFSIPDAKNPGSGKVSAGIETEVEHVRLENELKHGVSKAEARGGPIGLGFRVPMVIASPWSRGGKVCSEVFDHTSTLQFLEGFVNKKFGKNIRLNQISEWRRTICGDLTSAFSPYNGEALEKIPFLHREQSVKTIYDAQFKDIPTSFKKLSDEEIVTITASHSLPGLQEKGMRTACALPYELYANGRISADKQRFEIIFEAGKQLFGQRAAGSPFTVYSPVKFGEVGQEEVSRNWHFAVSAGDRLTYEWPIASFERGQYHLRLHGPNGFFRVFTGNRNNPPVNIVCGYEKDSGNLKVSLMNSGDRAHIISIVDHSYHSGNFKKTVAANGKETIILNLLKSFNWYDFSVKIEGYNEFEERFAGRVENGSFTKTDPLMGGIL